MKTMNLLIASALIAILFGCGLADKDEFSTSKNISPKLHQDADPATANEMGLVDPAVCGTDSNNQPGIPEGNFVVIYKESGPIEPLLTFRNPDLDAPPPEPWTSTVCIPSAVNVYKPLAIQQVQTRYEELHTQCHQGETPSLRRKLLTTTPIASTAICKSWFTEPYLLHPAYHNFKPFGSASMTVLCCSYPITPSMSPTLSPMSTPMPSYSSSPTSTSTATPTAFGSSYPSSTATSSSTPYNSQSSYPSASAYPSF